GSRRGARPERRAGTRPRAPHPRLDLGRGRDHARRPACTQPVAGRDVSSLNLVFTPFHRGGSGPPMVCLHGFTDSWRTWELVLPALERHHEVLAPTLPGHAGGPPLGPEITGTLLVEAVEQAMDEAGFATAHVAGNSRGGYVPPQL